MYRKIANKGDLDECERVCMIKNGVCVFKNPHLIPCVTAWKINQLK